MKTVNNLYDHEFRQKVIGLDKKSLAELTATLTAGMKVKVVKNTKETYHFVIPEDPNSTGLANIQAGHTSTLGTICLTASTYDAGRI